MSDAEYYASNINRLCTNLAFELRHVGGYFDKLEGRLEDGVWSRDFDLTAQQLGSAEQELRTLAGEFQRLRLEFVQRQPLIAAE